VTGLKPGFSRQGTFNIDTDQDHANILLPCIFHWHADLRLKGSCGLIEAHLVDENFLSRLAETAQELVLVTLPDMDMTARSGRRRMRHPAPETQYVIAMLCHPHCGACCIALSISSPLPNMPQGKAAGVPCVHLDQQLRCRIYDERPQVCRDFMASEFCGDSHSQALILLGQLERDTMTPLIP
jgi:hypothetical protein